MAEGGEVLFRFESGGEVGAWGDVGGCWFGGRGRCGRRVEDADENVGEFKAPVRDGVAIGAGGCKAVGGKLMLGGKGAGGAAWGIEGGVDGGVEVEV